MRDLDGPEIERRLRPIFGLALGAVSVDQGAAYWTVVTDTAVRFSTAHQIRACLALEIEPAHLEVDISPPNALLFVAQLPEVTKPEIPTAIAARGDRP